MPHYLERRSQNVASRIASRIATRSDETHTLAEGHRAFATPRVPRPLRQAQSRSIAGESSRRHCGHGGRCKRQKLGRGTVEVRLLAQLTRQEWNAAVRLTKDPHSRICWWRWLCDLRCRRKRNGFNPSDQAAELVTLPFNRNARSRRRKKHCPAPKNNYRPIDGWTASMHDDRWTATSYPPQTGQCDVGSCLLIERTTTCAFGKTGSGQGSASAASESKSLLEGRLVVATGVGIGRSKSLRKSASAERKRITSRNNALALYTSSREGQPSSHGTRTGQARGGRVGVERV